VSWRIFKNPLVLFVGGVAGVVLELAEPRVRTGVWDHSSFREQPLRRLQRTALAAMLSVYGARSRAEAMIARVRSLHEAVQGTTAAGERYRANDPELLTWVHATASFGFLEAYDRLVQPLSATDHDRFLREGLPIAERFGATSVPTSRTRMIALLQQTEGRLGPSQPLREFLEIVRHGPLLPGLLRTSQAGLVDAALALLPDPLRGRIGLGSAMRPVPRWVGLAGRFADRLVLDSSPAAAACRRVGWPVDVLYRPPD
jgi:uncharacterized protein (DUF2236 family)